MAAIDFPSSPTVGQSVTIGGVTWVFDGVKWTTSGSAGPAMPVAMNDNRIINGDMRIDQRNNGASGTAAGYTVDRWQYAWSQPNKFNWSRVNSGPTAFPYSFALTSTSAYAPLAADVFYLFQPIEADMVSDFAWGTSNAQAVTLSFWVGSSLTGTFGASITNYAGTRSYPFSYAIPTASTWTKIVVTIPGDTSGIWVMSGNGGAIYLDFDLGSGANYRAPAGAWASGNYVGANGGKNIVATNGATFTLTGVKLEVGSVATPFNRQSLAKSMADCQRYYQWLPYNMRFYATQPTTFMYVPIPFAMRAAPTISLAADAGGGVQSNANATGSAGISAIGAALTLQNAAVGDCYVIGYRMSANAEL